MNKQKRDLLKQRLIFHIPKDVKVKDELKDIFILVKLGRVTDLAILFQKIDKKKAVTMLSGKDDMGRTPLMYACYMNYKNIVLFLLYKGAQWGVIDNEQNSIFHVILDQGNYDSLVMIINYFYFELREEVDIRLKHIQKEFNIKRSDIRMGELVSTDKHLKHVKDNFTEFSDLVCKLYIDYHSKVSSAFISDQELLLFHSIQTAG